ncbi:hypothetical protein [Sphingobium sp. BS19]|uniref:hypothetical protein n=1 Tax=Sphingobium sp. BS19 TaxID=3018973 RepID=UPI0022EFA65D|nr:hypothetical protein [Sphingobium sp. BS19]GLI98895.1 hypothetical protein Sbs19_27130 [Sphingobium sp. BS19]
MLAFYKAAELEAALSISLCPNLETLLRKRVAQIMADGLGDFTHLLVVAADDTEAMIEEEVAFSPVVSDGIRFGQPNFSPHWDVLHNHGGWFEVTFCIGNGGWAVVLLIEDTVGGRFPELQAMCRAATD